ncbi:MAG: alpha/beta fold hydrolase [Actinomycetota bacterium]
MRTPASALSLRITALAIVLGLFVVACNQADAIRAEALASSTAVTFKTDDGLLLAGRLFGPEDAAAGVVLAHMLPADQSSWFDFAQRLASVGYRVVTFDFRGYCPGGDAGCSEGKKAVGAAWQDVLAAKHFLDSNGVSRVAFVGASMGGTASLVAASRVPTEIEAVITLSAPISIGDLSAGPEVVQVSGAAKLFLAGDGDVPAAEAATALFDESLQPKKLQVLTTADHGTDLLTGNQGEIARTEILAWLGQQLPLSEAPARS